MNIIWHDHPDAAVVKKCVELEKIRKADGTKTYWRMVREVMKTDPWFLMRVALEWGWLDEDIVGHSFIKHIATNWGEDLGALFPRGHGKTLPFSAMIMFAIINNPDIAILEISRTDDNASKIGSLIADNLLGNDYLQQCFSRKLNPDGGFLPSSVAECKYWGKDGYSLPWRKPRADPTLLTIPAKGAKAGKHPDIIWVDDPTEKENNDDVGHKTIEDMVKGLWFLAPAHGFMWWSGTRWHDGDPLGKAVAGKLRGKQGPFKFIQLSCYVDDDPTKGPTYPFKKRWNMDKPSGYTLEALDAAKAPEAEGGLGPFFAAQMRNDPAPTELQDIKVSSINLYTPSADGKDPGHPNVSEVRLMGIEVTGGGLPIYNGFVEHCDNLNINVPVVQISNPRTVGLDKRDRIVAALQPIVESGRLHAQKWMIHGEDTKNLGYELRRLGKATNDDIADALHNVPVHLAKGMRPSDPSQNADLYITVDLAWSEKQRSDWTVCMAVAIDSSGNHWILDYDRFQVSSPTGIYNRLLEFYQKFNEPRTIRQMSGKRYPGAWR